MSMKKISIALLLTGFAAGAYAQNSPMQSGGQGMNSGSQNGGQRQGPPPQAIDACKGKASGASCSFTGRQNNQVAGNCFSPPPRQTGSSTGNQGASSGQGERPMACRPELGGQGGGRGAPASAR
jgi:hypothetical protein